MPFFNPQEVLDTFNYSVRAPDMEGTPPHEGSGSGTSSLLATPRNPRQLYRKASSVKKLINKGSRSPTTLSKRALDELIKGCELAIYNAAMDLKELTDLRAESQVQKLKASRSKRQMTPNQGLQVAEARDLIALRNNALNEQAGALSSSALGPSAPPKRAPPTCSECNTRGHTRTRCPNRR
jgi:hypothetical protein